jgi:Protein of unknown function (DUF732)
MKCAMTAAFAAVGLIAAPVASADPEDRFLKNLEAGGFSWADEAAGQTLVGFGYDMCQELDGGASAADIITQGVNQTDWTGTQWGYFIGAAASAFCPQHLGRALEEAKTLDG